MALIDIVVKPRSHAERIVVDSQGLVTVAVTAPPVEGAANAEVVKLLARTLHVPQSSLSIVRGSTGRRKVVTVEGLDRAAVLQRLRTAANP